MEGARTGQDRLISYPRTNPMRIRLLAILATVALAGIDLGVSAAEPVPVTVENFNRAESDLYFSGTVKIGGFGKFTHYREPTPIDAQTVIRMNRDTLYSAGVFDLDAGPVTITVPDAGTRFLSMQVINEDHYTQAVIYKAGTYTFTRAKVGTRYFIAAVRILIDPAKPSDAKEVHALQDRLIANQPGGPGAFEIPNWDPASQKRVRDALLVLGSTLPDTHGAFGRKEDVDPVRFLVGSALGWGGNPEKEALYINVKPPKNDGTTVHRLTVKDVPVDGFWSVSVYNAEGFFEKNEWDAYTVNNLTARKDADGSITIQFGGRPGSAQNLLPIPPGWNYMVRLYRPREEILRGTWKFPEAAPSK